MATAAAIVRRDHPLTVASPSADTDGGAAVGQIVASKMAVMHQPLAEQHLARVGLVGPFEDHEETLLTPAAFFVNCGS